METEIATELTEIFVSGVVITALVFMAIILGAILARIVPRALNED